MDGIDSFASPPRQDDDADSQSPPDWLRAFLDIIKQSNGTWDFERISRLNATQWVALRSPAAEESAGKIPVYSASAGNGAGNEDPAKMTERVRQIERIWNHFHGPDAKRRRFLRSIGEPDV